MQLISKLKTPIAGIKVESQHLLQTGNRNISSPHDQNSKDCETITSISFSISEFYLHGIHLMPNHVSASSL